MEFLKYMKNTFNNRKDVKIEKYEIPHQNVFQKLEDNIDYVNSTFCESSDLIIKNIKIHNIKGSILYLESITDYEIIEKDFFSILDKSKEEDLNTLLESTKIEVSSELSQAIKLLLGGYCILFLDGYDKVFLFPANKTHNRKIKEPDNEKVVRGSHEGFVEDLMINLNLIRKKIENPKLTIKYFTVGIETKTRLALVFMDNLANPNLVQEVKKRIDSISNDMVMSPGFMEEFIEDSPSSVFPQVLNTERPDRVMAQLLEGRVAITAEGSPTVSIIPVTFFSFYQSPDDYNSRWITATFFRLIRLLSFIIAVTLPSLYIAVIAFHFEVIPVDLVLLIKSSINDIPYPPLIEAFILEIIIELIREAGIRLPTPIGQTIAIVGGLVIGDAIVKAGLVSNVMIIVIALTAIASFAIPSNEMVTTVTILRLPFMFLASFLGFVGITFGMIFLLIHLCKLESFGTPYFAPLAPLRLQDLKDTFIRLPLWTFYRRPLDSHPKKMKRQASSREWKHNEERNE